MWVVHARARTEPGCRIHAHWIRSAGLFRPSSKSSARRCVHGAIWCNRDRRVDQTLVTLRARGRGAPWSFFENEPRTDRENEPRTVSSYGVASVAAVGAAVGAGAD